MSAAFQIYGSQAMYDLATPDDTPEPPDMSDKIEALMFGDDTDLVAVDDFKLSAEESMFDMDIRPFDVINLVLAACRSDDIVMRALSARLRKGLQEHAGKMLDEAHAEAVKKFQTVGYEP